MSHNIFITCFWLKFRLLLINQFCQFFLKNKGFCNIFTILKEQEKNWLLLLARLLTPINFFSNTFEDLKSNLSNKLGFDEGKNFRLIFVSFFQWSSQYKGTTEFYFYDNGTIDILLGQAPQNHTTSSE